MSYGHAHQLFSCALCGKPAAVLGEDNRPVCPACIPLVNPL